MNTVHPAWIEIDMAAFRQNLSAVREKAKGALLCLTVKANAYGHGLVPMAKEAETWGVDRLAVAYLKEAVELRRSGIQCPVLILGAIHEEQIGDCLDFGLEFSVSSRLRAMQVAEQCARKNKVASVHLEVDTGMRRTGMRPETAFALFQEIKSQECFNIQGIYSHFATADGPGDPFAHEQIASFKALRARIGPEGSRLIWHLANSGGVSYYPESHFDMVRPGLLCYGLTSDGQEDSTLQPLFSLRAKVSYFKVVQSQQGISYGHSYTTSKQTRVITIPIGYGDGYVRGFSNKAPILLRGKRYTVSGNVCMDQFMVDIGPSEAYVGDIATLVGCEAGEAVTLWDLARLLHTDPREVLCLFNNRLPRRYLDSSKNVPNAETLRAIGEIERGENLVEARDAQDLFEKLKL
jgi:alanine racemase